MSRSIFRPDGTTGRLGNHEKYKRIEHDLTQSVQSYFDLYSAQLSRNCDEQMQLIESPNGADEFYLISSRLDLIVSFCVNWLRSNPLDDEAPLTSIIRQEDEYEHGT